LPQGWMRESGMSKTLYVTIESFLRELLDNLYFRTTVKDEGRIRKDGRRHNKKIENSRWSTWNPSRTSYQSQLFTRLSFVKVNASSEMSQDEGFLKAEQLLQKIKETGNDDEVENSPDALNSGTSTAVLE
jgi:hypothetical protein